MIRLLLILGVLVLAGMLYIRHESLTLREGVTFTVIGAERA